MTEHALVHRWRSKQKDRKDVANKVGGDWKTVIAWKTQGAQMPQKLFAVTSVFPNHKSNILIAQIL